MATPSRMETAKAQKGSIYNENECNPTEKSRYLALKYDVEHNSLPGWKREEYEELRLKYEN